MTEPKLKPCPFCGGKAEALESTFCVWKVFCTECGAKMEITTDADAEVLWNRRVPQRTATMQVYDSFIDDDEPKPKKNR